MKKYIFIIFFRCPQSSVFALKLMLKTGTGMITSQYGTSPCRVNEYLELPARVELLNSRFSVLQEMLDMVRNHQVSTTLLSYRLDMCV